MSGVWWCSPSTRTERRRDRCRTVDQTPSSRPRPRQVTAAAKSDPRAGSDCRPWPKDGVRTSATTRTATLRTRQSSTSPPLPSSLRRTGRTGQKRLPVDRPVPAELRQNDRTASSSPLYRLPVVVRSSTAPVCRSGTPSTRAVTQAGTTRQTEACGRRRPVMWRRWRPHWAGASPVIGRRFGRLRAASPASWTYCDDSGTRFLPTNHNMDRHHLD